MVGFVRCEMERLDEIFDATANCSFIDSPGHAGTAALLLKIGFPTSVASMERMYAELGWPANLCLRKEDLSTLARCAYTRLLRSKTATSEQVLLRFDGGVRATEGKGTWTSWTLDDPMRLEALKEAAVQKLKLRWLSDSISGGDSDDGESTAERRVQADG